MFRSCDYMVSNSLRTSSLFSRSKCWQTSRQNLSVVNQQMYDNEMRKNEATVRLRPSTALHEDNEPSQSSLDLHYCCCHCCAQALNPARINTHTLMCQPSRNVFALVFHMKTYNIGADNWRHLSRCVFLITVPPLSSDV